MGKKVKIVQPEWVRTQMEERICKSTHQEYRLAQAIYDRAVCLPQEREAAQRRVLDEMKRSSQAMTEALILLFGEAEAHTLLRVLRLRMEGPIAETIFRTPFRSADADDYTEGIILPTVYRWIYGTGCPVTVLDCLTRTDLIVPGEFDLADRLALELREGNEAVEHAVVSLFSYRENDSIPPLSKPIIQGIIRSGSPELLNRVKGLLVNRSEPQKLRSEILSSLDEGSVDTLIDFLNTIYEERLYRSPMVARMIDTWLWLGFGALEPELAQLALRDGLYFLLHPEQCAQAWESDDPMTVHLALWAMGVRNVKQIRPQLSAMLSSPQKQSVISALYFINNVEHQYLDYDITVQLLEETRDPELLAWLVPNLIPQDLEERLPHSAQGRQKQFSMLEHLLFQIGREERTFSGKPFPWTVRKLSCELVAECMLRMAYFCEDRSMIRALGRSFDYLTPSQRGFYYEFLLDPIRWREDGFFLQSHQRDRSRKNRKLVEERLEWVKTQKKERK